MTAGAPPTGGLTRYATDADEAGGLGDAMDLLNVRDAAVMRYLRYHEWIDLVVGSPVPTHALVAPPVKTGAAATENELMSLYIQPILEQQKREAEQEEAKTKASPVGLSERAKVLAKLTEQLRQGLDGSADDIKKVEAEVKAKLGVSVVYKPKFDVIREPSPSISDESSALQQQHAQESHQLQQLGQQQGLQEQSQPDSQVQDADEDMVMGNNEFGFEYSEPDTTFEATVPTDTGLNLDDDGTGNVNSGANSMTTGPDHIAVTSTSNGSLDFKTQSHQQQLDTGLLDDDAGSEFISLGNDTSDPNNDSVLNLLDL